MTFTDCISAGNNAVEMTPRVQRAISGLWRAKCHGFLTYYIVISIIKIPGKWGLVCNMPELIT